VCLCLCLVLCDVMESYPFCAQAVIISSAPTLDQSHISVWWIESQCLVRYRPLLLVCIALGVGVSSRTDITMSHIDGPILSVCTTTGVTINGCADNWRTQIIISLIIGAHIRGQLMRIIITPARRDKRAQRANSKAPCLHWETKSNPTRIEAKGGGEKATRAN